MNTTPRYCESCGSQLPPDVKFCLQCGAPVPEKSPAEPDWITGLSQPGNPQPETPQPESQPAPATPPPSYSTPSRPAAAYTPPPAPPAGPRPAPSRKLPCLIIGGIAVLGLICVVILAVVALLFFKPVNRTTTGVATGVVVEQLPFATVAPSPTQEPAAAIASQTPPDGPTETLSATETIPEATQEMPFATVPPEAGGKAFINDFSIFDPFDDNQLGWDTDSASDLTTAVENGAYSMYTPEVSTYFWVYPPVEFDPVVLEFDAWVDASTSTEDLGTYGVVCNLQDINNFTFVEVDPSDGTVYFARIENDEETSLRDQDWSDLNNLLTGAGETNHIMVECYPDSLSLFVNEEFEASVSLDPPASPGRSAIMIGTWDTIDPKGYKVYFDNFYAYIPQQ